MFVLWFISLKAQSNDRVKRVRSELTNSTSKTATSKSTIELSDFILFTYNNNKHLARVSTLYWNGKVIENLKWPLSKALPVTKASTKTGKAAATKKTALIINIYSNVSDNETNHSSMNTNPTSATSSNGISNNQLRFAIVSSQCTLFILKVRWFCFNLIFYHWIQIYIYICVCVCVCVWVSVCVCMCVRIICAYCHSYLLQQSPCKWNYLHQKQLRFASLRPDSTSLSVQRYN